MPKVRLKYGSGTIEVEIGKGFDILKGREAADPLTDSQINEKLDVPVDSPPLEELVHPGESVLFAVSDATRHTAAGQILNLVVRRLIANGTAPHQMRVIFATGIHRKVTEAERQQILTPFIADRIRSLDHDPRDLVQLVKLGETTDGTPVELNRALFEFDHVVLIGGISFHYFAGFTGGRKLVCPGLASSRTVSATHRLAFDFERLCRRDGVGSGRLAGNPVNEAFVEAATFAAPRFLINTVVDEQGRATDVIGGDWRTSHVAACEKYASDNTVAIKELRELVVVSCGGSPHDINMIQAHKGLEAASHGCAPGGTIVLIAECRDGLGRGDFADWFDVANSGELALRLREKYQVNGQTAWSLLEKAERFRIKIVSDLDNDLLKKMRLEKIEAARLGEIVRDARSGYLIPHGAKTAILQPTL